MISSTEFHFIRCPVAEDIFPGTGPVSHCAKDAVNKIIMQIMAPEMLRLQFFMVCYPFCDTAELAPHGE